MKRSSSNNPLKPLNSASFCAIFSAALYALCIPLAKLLSPHIGEVFLGGFLYLGAGLGLILVSLLKKKKPDLVLGKKELPYTILMVVLDILAIISLMFGLKYTTGASASLIGNFELVMTTLIAGFVFGEFVSKRLAFAIILITLACIILNFEGKDTLIFNFGSLFVLLSATFWGFENNCTKMLSKKDTIQIATIKGVFSGLGSLVIANIIGEGIPDINWIVLALLLGFISYGLSVCLYIYSQRFLGASKTGAYYAMAPFFGVVFSLLILNETLTVQFYIALFIMILGSLIVFFDTKNS